MSTNDLRELQRLAALAAERGVATLEAPVTSSIHRAFASMITVLVSSNEAVFRTHLPAFEAMDGPVFYVGELGKASVIKVTANVVAFIHLVADGEALMLAKRGGVDLKLASEVDQGQLGQQLRPRDRGPAHPERQLRRRLHHGPGA